MVVAGPTSVREDPRRRPLTPSDNSNADVASSRRPRNKEIASRYLSYNTTSPSPSPSTSTSYSSPSARRFPSPTVSSRSLPTPHQRRSSSVDRCRPSPGSTSTTTSNSTSSTNTTTTTTTTTTTMTRSLAVSFGGSFSYQTSRAKPTPMPGRRSLEYGQQNRPWPAAVRSLDYSPTGHCDGIEEKGGVGEVSGSSDTDSVSSGSNSGSHEFMLPPRSRVTARGICVPARFFQESHVRQRPVRHPSPSKVTSSSPARGMSSPLRGRGGSPAASQANQQPLNAPSILSFAMEVRRAKKGEYRIEEAHLLRLLDNRHLQWRFVNAKFDSAMQDQKQVSEKNLYNAWRCISELRESVAIRRMKLQTLNQNLRLASILKRQALYLEEWSKMEEEHSSSLVCAIESLKASTLRLPVVGGAKADIQKLKEVTSSAINTFLLMESSNSFLSKVHRTCSLVHQLGAVAFREHMLLDQCRDLLSTVVALHVKQCSLEGQLIQLTSTLSQEQT